MKLIILFTILSSILTLNTFAAETKTECPWMKEMMSRSNPKANLGQSNSKVALKSAISSKQ